MTPILGGVFADGAFKRGMASEAAGTFNTTLSQWLTLGRDPRGGDTIGLLAYISDRDYDDYPGQSKYRSELRGQSTITPWGVPYWYYWRMVIPPGWVNLGAGSEVIIGQIHDVNGGAVGRRPTLAIEVTDGDVNVVWSRDSVPGGEVRASVPAVAGHEYEFAIQVFWADGTNAPAEFGFARTFIDGAQVDDFTGLNTWAGTPITEPNPPYIKCGVYQPGPDFAWWTGKSALMFYPCCMTADGLLPLGELQDYANRRLEATRGTSIKSA